MLRPSPHRRSSRVSDHIEVIQPSMRNVIHEDAEPVCIAEGLRFTEGPCWWASAGCLIFSDIPADTLYRWTEQEGAAVFRRPSRRANGNTVDMDGNLITCEHGSRTVTRTTPGCDVTTIASSYRGRKLNSPNDVVVRSDGAVWFTDPPYGVKPEEREQPANYVFRLDPGADEPMAACDSLSRPNGLCFSPDERILYIADSDTETHHIRRFGLGPDNTLTGGDVFAVIGCGVPDGLRCDADGRLYSTAGDGVWVFDAGGTLLGKIHTPETAANCTFGGTEGRTLFITATSRVWAVDLKVAGA